MANAIHRCSFAHCPYPTPLPLPHSHCSYPLPLSLPHSRCPYPTPTEQHTHTHSATAPHPLLQTRAIHCLAKPPKNLRVSHTPPTDLPTHNACPCHPFLLSPLAYMSIRARPCPFPTRPPVATCLYEYPCTAMPLPQPPLLLPLAYMSLRARPCRGVRLQRAHPAAPSLGCQTL